MTLLIIYLILLAITLTLLIGAYRKPIEEKNVFDDFPPSFHDMRIVKGWDENSYC
jgi:hypothetical protein